eukprot:CAMPEP_0117668246 /NCGR_PEP_ID=MMETSP0804-20121206/11438_1 /TAXON_ID=1074897 /ORGANISM="Tetraselmis astigmatica, Strain CCMP880" /LENGTH=716 /DNA_ID=CAMNT_0005476107 /DNA_START=139 /DNA_END=2290 /DNA_ORIENTATION=+
MKMLLRLCAPALRSERPAELTYDRIFSELQNFDAAMASQDLSVDDLGDMMRSKLEIKDRKYHMKSYPSCFLGSDAVKVIVEAGAATSTEEALAVGNAMISAGIFHHVTKDHPLKDEPLFYRFKADNDEFHGGTATDDAGQKASWSMWANKLITGLEGSDGRSDLQANLPEYEGADSLEPGVKDINVSPLDEHNVKLLDNVHPAKWIDPEPQPKYNMVCIGAGAGGLVSSSIAAGLGGKVAIIEEHLMGGDCLNVGCVPSKALIRAARAAHEARNAAEFGISCGEVKVDFGKVMERMRRLRAQISPADSSARYAEMGVDVFQGRGKFLSKDAVEVNGKVLKFSTAVIATGGSPAVPPIKGIQDVPYMTNASFFNQTELPARFGVIGSGVIGVELAQCMQRFGSQVTVFGRSGRILEKEDADAVQIVKAQLVKDGITFMLKVKYNEVTKAADGSIHISIFNNEAGADETIVVDALLVATGRKPNVTGVGLEEAGVNFDKKNGVLVDDNLRTNVKSIFAVGDCCSAYKFTHVADFMARMVARNALFFGKAKFSSLLIPWATFTEPEVAHVGLYPADLEEKGIKYSTFVRNLDDVDRAILDGQDEGFVKIHTKAGSDTILGATIVAADAGNMISEISVAMQGGMGLGSLANVIHPYPTQSEAIRQAGDMYNRTKLTPFVKSSSETSSSSVSVEHWPFTPRKAGYASSHELLPQTLQALPP